MSAGKEVAPEQAKRAIDLCAAVNLTDAGLASQ